MLTLFSSAKTRLNINEFDLTSDAILTNAINAISFRFDKETKRTLARTVNKERARHGESKTASRLSKDSDGAAEGRHHLNRWRISVKTFVYSSRARPAYAAHPGSVASRCLGEGEGARYKTGTRGKE